MKQGYFETLFKGTSITVFITFPRLLEAVGLQFQAEALDTLIPFILRFHITVILFASLSPQIHHVNNINTFDSHFFKINLLVNLMTTWLQYCIA
jgi:hypothetical protein